MGLFDSGEKVRLRVEGMTCGHCESTVQGALQGVPGVRKAQVSLKDGMATVTYDPRTAGPDALVRAVEEAGYHAEPAG